MSGGVRHPHCSWQKLTLRRRQEMPCACSIARTYPSSRSYYTQFFPSRPPSGPIRGLQSSLSKFYGALAQLELNRTFAAAVLTLSIYALWKLRKSST